MTAHGPSNSEAIHSSGSLDFFHPTARYHPLTATTQRPREQQLQTPDQAVNSPASPATTEDGSSKTQQVHHVWRSRDNRKGRHRALVTGRDAKADDEGGECRLVKKTGYGLTRLVTRFPVWDISYLVAVAFVFGSVIWCINACFVFLPLVAPASEFPGETVQGGGILAFTGSTVFVIGSVLMVVEAVNAERSDCFGWALEESLEDHGLRLRPRHEGCRHPHRSRHDLLKDSAVAAMAATAFDSVAEPGGLEERKGGDDGNVRSEKERRWQWWPTWHELKTHYTKEIGFLASFIQLLGSCIFWISAITSLPPIYTAMSAPVMNGVYWAPKVVGGTGFMVSALMFMVEVQDKWYKPAPKTIGWHVGFWNLIGGIGFTLSAAVGFGSQSSPALKYASRLSTFVGSWAFLIGAVAQWYESLDKYPVSVEEAPTWLPSGEKVV